MKIVRGPREAGFAIIPNTALEDERLSWRARGVLAYLLSRPDGWNTSADRLALVAPEGRRAILTALSELESAGYLSRARVADERGRWSTVATLTDSPQAVRNPVDNSTEVRLPHVGSPNVGGAHASSKTENKNPPTPPGAGSCPTHGNNPASRCRGCGTSPRQLRAVADAESRRRPSWCGSCDERTRMLHDAEDRPRRCPSCHPLEVAS